MAQAAAHAFATGSLGDQDNPTRAVAVVQAGAGVGKSAAYIAPGVAIALARTTRLLIASSTVALQEQLVNKDLPAFAKAMPEAFTFALAKGRGRYLCRLKALRQARLAPQQAGFDLDFDPDEPFNRPALRAQHSQGPAPLPGPPDQGRRADGHEDDDDDDLTSSPPKGFAL